MNPDLSQWPLSRLLITAGRMVENDIAEQLRFLHLTHASHAVLALIGESPRSQRELARATRVEEQTISRLIDRLEREGLVTREPDPSDRRRHLITATTAGLNSLREAASQDRAERLLANIPDAQRLRESLTRLIDQLGTPPG